MPLQVYGDICLPECERADNNRRWGYQKGEGIRYRRSLTKKLRKMGQMGWEGSSNGGIYEGQLRVATGHVSEANAMPIGTAQNTDDGQSHCIRDLASLAMLIHYWHGIDGIVSF